MKNVLNKYELAVSSGKVGVAATPLRCKIGIRLGTAKKVRREWMYRDIIREIFERVNEQTVSLAALCSRRISYQKARKLTYLNS